MTDGTTTDMPMTSSSDTSGPGPGTTSTGADSTDFPEPKLDLAESTDTGDVFNCATDGTCPQVDLVFIIDNSGSMGEEQLNLASSFQPLIDGLEGMVHSDTAEPINPDVNIIVTTTDMGHPLCTAFQPADYTPSFGAPIHDGCNARITRFTGLDLMNPVSIPEACTENCPSDILPEDHFINFHASGSNVPNDDATAALACLGPQGINGCGFESPLETMLQAINEQACWNDPDQPGCDDQPEWADVTKGFLRDGAVLAIAMVTDELDCSVQQPSGYSYFTDIGNTVYWNVNPETAAPQATSAICFNAGVTCTDGDDDGIYEECFSQDNDVLHPVGRYTSYLDYLRDKGKEVVMLGLLGVPEVSTHNPEPPFEPTSGGAIDLLYRGDWLDFPYPAGDITPAEWKQGIRAVDKAFGFGDLAPGCMGASELSTVTSQALPPVRVREVCESLDSVDEESGEPIVRCCIESVCSGDYAPTLTCLTGLISEAIERERP